MKPSNKPIALMRKWYFDGEIPKKERDQNGRLDLPTKFKFLPITTHKCFEDDIPLVQLNLNDGKL